MKTLFLTFLMLFFIDFSAFGQDTDEKSVEINDLPPQLVENCKKRLPNATLLSGTVNENIGDYAVKWSQGAKKGSILYRNNGNGVFGYVLLKTEYTTPKDVTINIPANIQQTFLKIISKGKTANWTKIDNQNGAKNYLATLKIDNFKVEFEINVVPNTKANSFNLTLTGEGVVDAIGSVISMPIFNKMLNINENISKKIDKTNAYATTKKYVLSPFYIKFDGKIPLTSTQKGEADIYIRAKINGDKAKEFSLFYVGDGKVQESSF